MYTGLIILAIVMVLALIAMIFFMSRDSRADARRWRNLK
jgi:hypothetical protein